MAYAPHPAFQKLFTIFTSDPDSMGAHLTNALVKDRADDPLLVTTGTDVVLFPGDGRAPKAESFRRTTRGFIEITAVSHLGLTIPWLIRLRELQDPTWKVDAERLLAQLEQVRAVNSPEHWRQIDVVAWHGLEGKIADLVDYTCAVTADFLQAGLADERKLSFARLREQYLDPPPPGHVVPVPINDIMAATFALAFLDIAYRIIAWLRAQPLDWARLMALITGQAGRPTAGLTWQTNNMCHLLWQASDQSLPPERVYIAPHAPAIAVAELGDTAKMADIENNFRRIWLNTRASVELGRLMFDGYPAFQPVVEKSSFVDADTLTVDRMPAIKSTDDRRAVITRLRMVMEDPGQLISNAAAHYVIDQLCANGNRPEQVIIPGFTGVEYRHRA